MKISSLLEISTKFHKLAQQTLSMRDFINVNLPNTLTYKEAAEKVLQDLKSIDPDESDAGIKSSNNSILDILNSPLDAEVNQASLLAAANQAYELIKRQAPGDQEKNNNARYLVILTQVLTNAAQKMKERNQEVSVRQEDAPNIDREPEAKPAENQVKFLQRMYQVARSGQQPTANDMALWGKYKPMYVRRLNGLKSMTTPTAAQNSEKQVLQLVIDRLG